MQNKNAELKIRAQKYQDSKLEKKTVQAMITTRRNKLITLTT